ncbi:hypothetical protein GCM10025864_05740 [Luteimicrobium album]|uniref:Uncharacterized protein n=1 Tax=Luteimicrobium album TaxID=1054550 RepID=A0ABQ6HZ52_9MICO|nr:hypothetical protein GCM10025864_05740 [Luteimicrobium album]
MDRAGPAGPRPPGGGDRARGEVVEVAQLGREPGGGRHVDREPGRSREDPDLVGGLVGARAAQLVGAVGGEEQQGDARVVRLEDGRVEVRDRRARRRHDRDRFGHPSAQRAPAGEAEREEPGVALVDADVQVEAPGVGEGARRVRERGTAGAGGDDDVPQPLRDEGVEQAPGRCHGGRVAWCGVLGVHVSRLSAPGYCLRPDGHSRAPPRVSGSCRPRYPVAAGSGVPCRPGRAVLQAAE